jgi:subtilisin family serine protease
MEENMHPTTHSRIARSLNGFVATVLMMSSLFLGGAKPVQAKHSPKIDYQDGVVLVGVRGDTVLEQSGVRANSSILTSKLAGLNVHSAKPLFSSKSIQKASFPGTDLAQVYRLELDPTVSVSHAVEVLSANPNLAFAEPDYLGNATDVSTSPSYSPNDPLYGVQWGLAKIDIETAWTETEGSPTVIIAIIDSGIDLTHVDLADHLWVNPGEIPGNGLDDDNNGFIDDVHGWNFVSNTNDVSDDNGHGTLVSGVAAAIANNGQGVAGVCPHCTILPVKAMQASGVANYSAIASAIRYAADKGAKVINLSLGGYANSNTLSNAINYAISKGAVLVAGAGNDHLTQPFYPAAYDSVLAVAGTKNDDTKESFSNYGTWVDVSAPAYAIRTTALGGDWANGSGTSMASPFAAGLAGLLLAQHPDWDQALVRSQIIHTTDPIDSLNPTYVGLLGSGRLNAGTAMQPPHPVLQLSGYSVNGLAAGRPVLGASASLVITIRNDWWNAASVTGTLNTTDSHVTLTTATADFGDIGSSASVTNPTAFTFTVNAGAGYNYPIPFTLDVHDTGGYSASFNFTINTETGIVTKSGTLITQTWTNDKTYLITNNISVPTGNTLTIEPGTVVKFNGNFNLSIRGTLIADGTEDLPITFKHNIPGSTWGYILFDDLAIDAIADVDGNYTSGNILRHVDLQDSSGGIDCNTATPYLWHISLTAGGIVCSLGSTSVWLQDSTINGGASFTGPGFAYRNTVSGNVALSGAGAADDNNISGGLSLGSGSAHRNTITGGTLAVSIGGTIVDNSISGGFLSAGSTASIINNSIDGGAPSPSGLQADLTAGSGSIIDHNIVKNGKYGIFAGDTATITWNNIENVQQEGIGAGSDATIQWNRSVDNGFGIIGSTGLIEHNLFSNSSYGVKVGAATVQYNTFTGSYYSAIYVEGGIPITIAYNNLVTNTGSYDLYINIPGAATVPAEHNWWGTTDDSAIADRIFDWYDDDLKATADYTNQLIAPDQTAPGYIRSVTVLPDTTLGIEMGTFQIQFSRPMDINTIPQMSFNGSIPFTWKPRANMPTSRLSLGVATASNGKIYAIGGFAGSTVVPTVEEYDPVTDTWVTRSNMPTARHTLGVATASNGKIYAIGGFAGSTAVPTVEEYDPVSDTWATRANMPTARYMLGIASASNGKIYAIGGADANNISLRVVEEYDPVTDTWATRADMPTARYNFGVAYASNGKIYAIGGDDGRGNELSTVEEYDPVTDTWATRAKMPTARYNLGVAAASNGRLYAIGGYNLDNWRYPWVEEYEPVANAWKTRPNIPTARSDLGVVTASNGKIYAIGGYDGAREVSTVEELTLPYGTTTFYGSQWLSTSQYQANYDITSLVPKDTYHVTVEVAYDSDSMAIVPFSNATFTVDYAGSISDTTPPDQPVVGASGDGSLTTIFASWSSSDPESPITMYRYAIGTAPGLRDVVAWTYTNNTSMNRKNLNLTAGVKYYVSVGARNEGGLWSQDGISNKVIAGQVTSFSISGNAGVGSATITYTDGSTTADTNGDYSFPIPYNWTGTVTLSKTGYTFTPHQKDYSNVLANQTGQNYTATPITFTISGNAGVSGATLSYTDDTPKTTNAGVDGSYSFTVSYNWTGTVTPSKTGYTFTPHQKDYSNVLANQTGQNYTATPLTFTISGNAGVSGASITYTGGSTMADTNGDYSFSVPYNWTGTVTPSKTGYTFTPSHKGYASILANQTGQNYTASTGTGYSVFLPLVIK